jgi:hypothetical protein
VNVNSKLAQFVGPCPLACRHDWHNRFWEGVLQLRRCAGGEPPIKTPSSHPGVLGLGRSACVCSPPLCSTRNHLDDPSLLVACHKFRLDCMRNIASIMLSDSSTIAGSHGPRSDGTPCTIHTHIHIDIDTHTHIDIAVWPFSPPQFFVAISSQPLVFGIWFFYR